MGCGESKEQKEQKKKELLEAAEAGDLATVKKLLDGRVNTDAAYAVRAARVRIQLTNDETSLTVCALSTSFLCRVCRMVRLLSTMPLRMATLRSLSCS